MQGRRTPNQTFSEEPQQQEEAQHRAEHPDRLLLYRRALETLLRAWKDVLQVRFLRVQDTHQAKQYHLAAQSVRG